MFTQHEDGIKSSKLGGKSKHRKPSGHRAERQERDFASAGRNLRIEQIRRREASMYDVDFSAAMA